VLVTAVNTSGYPMPNFSTTAFQNAHPPGAKVILFLYPGNPGPQSVFDLKTNTAVVPYFSIIN
jgi:hypothetical protein